MMNRTLTITFMVAMSALSSIGAHANSKMEHRLKLLEMLEKAEFQEAIDEADACTRKQDFKCARKRISEAEELASTSGQYEVLRVSKDLLDGEENLVALAKEEKALKERMRRERIAEEKRQREWEAEQQRQREMAERKAREKRDKQRAISAAIGLGAGYAAVSNGADAELAEQIFDQTSTGAYAVMSGDQEAARKYQQLQSNMQKNLDDFQVRQERLRREQAERRRRHQEIIDRHEENLRANENKPVYAVRQQKSDSASSRSATPVQGGSSESRAQSVNGESTNGTRYVLHKMDGIDPVPVRVTPKYTDGPSHVLGQSGSVPGSSQSGKGTNLGAGGVAGRDEDIHSADDPSLSSDVSGIEDAEGSIYPEKARARIVDDAMHCASAVPHDKDENKWLVKNSCVEKIVVYLCGTLRWQNRRCGDSEEGNYYTLYKNLEPLQTIEVDVDHDEKPSYLRYAACKGHAYSGDYIVHKKEDNGRFTCLYKKYNH